MRGGHEALRKGDWPSSDETKRKSDVVELITKYKNVVQRRVRGEGKREKAKKGRKRERKQ